MANKKYVRGIVKDYCVLDTETTGLSVYYDEVIEIGIIKVRNDIVVDRFSQLIKPEYEIDSFITSLTGITNEMVYGKPSINEIKDRVLNFIGDDIIVGHNTSFDIRFLREGFNQDLDNNYMDTMQFARKIFPELKHHRLSDLTKYLQIQNNEHRALSDCIATKELYDSIKSIMFKRELTVDDLWISKKYSDGIDISSIKPAVADIKQDNFFYNKCIVFTGKLEKMLRKDAMQLIVNLGGIPDKGVTKKTNYLILGNSDYNAILRGKKSSKHIKAEKLKLEGFDIEIIDELTFYDILEDIL